MVIAFREFDCTRCDIRVTDTPRIHQVLRRVNKTLTAHVRKRQFWKELMEFISIFVQVPAELRRRAAGDEFERIATVRFQSG